MIYIVHESQIDSDDKRSFLFKTKSDVWVWGCISVQGLSSHHIVYGIMNPFHHFNGLWRIYFPTRRCIVPPCEDDKSQVEAK